MQIELTRHQQEALDQQQSGPLRVIDPRTHGAYILLREEDYDRIREILDEETRGKAIRAVALRNAAGRMNEAP